MGPSYLYLAGGVIPLPGTRFWCRTTICSPKVSLEASAGSKWPYKWSTQTETKGSQTVCQFFTFSLPCWTSFQPYAKTLR